MERAKRDAQQYRPGPRLSQHVPKNKRYFRRQGPESQSLLAEKGNQIKTGNIHKKCEISRK